MEGMLYLCATPIGNLEDITLRVLRILEEVDVIAAEDTRNSIKLLNHFEIKTPMTSYHEFNKIEKGHFLIREMSAGKKVALISDAGTPGISDPGEELVSMCHQAGIPVTALPGAAACITAVTMSGMPTRRFVFEGFIPKEKKKYAPIIEELKQETRTIILYESPHHLLATLELLQKELGDREISICRELTKKFETCMVTTLSQGIQYYQENKPKGEFVLVLKGKSLEEVKEEGIAQWEKMTVESHMEYYLEQGIDQKEAMKRVAKDRGMTKREIYQKIHVEN